MGWSASVCHLSYYILVHTKKIGNQINNGQSNQHYLSTLPKTHYHLSTHCRGVEIDHENIIPGMRMS